MKAKFFVFLIFFPMFLLNCKPLDGIEKGDQNRLATNDADGPLDTSRVPKLYTDGNKGVRICGLINCVGVVAKIYPNATAFSHDSAVAGHFESPTMFDFKENKFTQEGQEFINKIRKLLKGKEFDLELYIAAGAEEGMSASQAQKQAREAATAINEEFEKKGAPLSGCSSVEINW